MLHAGKGSDEKRLSQNHSSEHAVRPEDGNVMQKYHSA